MHLLQQKVINIIFAVAIVTLIISGCLDLFFQSTNKNMTLLIAVSAGTTLLLVFCFLMISYQLYLRLRAERLKQMAENQLQGIIEGTQDLIAALDLKMNFIAFNKAYRQRFKNKFGKNIVIGDNLRQLLNGNTADELETIHAWERALSGEEFTLIKRTDDDTFYEATFNTIRNDDKERIGASHIIHNITQRKIEEINLKSTNEKLQAGLQELETRYHEIALSNEMSEALQSCLTLEEAYSPIKTYCQQIFPHSKGIVYLMHASRTYLELAVAFGEPVVSEYTFAPEACWALRRNQIHRVENAEQSIVCTHAKAMHPDELTPYVCVPLMAHNETLGLFYLEMPQNVATANPLTNNHRQLLLTTMAEQISLALANIKLRETLRFLSVRDPLTGLYNRRYLEETLVREFHRAERKKNSVAIIMADIDHFKRFNDTYGHDAGDCVLRRVGKLFQETTRGSDVICRFGGEEFLIFLYDTDLEAAKVYAERIQKVAGELDIQYGGKTLGAITISLGIAVFPTDGTKPQGLIEAADEALYRAKKAGRNCIKLANDPIIASDKLNQ